jgi:hypothetical protein
MSVSAAGYYLETGAAVNANIAKIEGVSDHSFF